MKTDDPTTTEAWKRAEELAEQLRPEYFDNLIDFDAEELLNEAADQLLAMKAALNLRDEWKLAYEEAEKAREAMRDEWNAAESRASEARSLALEECILAATGTTIDEAMALAGLDRTSTHAPSAIMREAIVTKLVAIRALGKDES